MITIETRFPTDANGLAGRECPQPDCLGYFKIKFGTGLSGPNLPCHCPYCGHTAPHDQFWTQDQLKLMRSKIEGHAVKLVDEWSKRLESESRHSQGVRFKAHRNYVRTHRYSEKELETEVTCEECTLVYAVYGVFAYCPDCGQHNSLQILAKNIDIVNRTLDWAAGLDDELRSKQVEYTLEGCVSAFDGFGRGLCRAHSARCGDPAKLERLSFQRLDDARQSLVDLLGVDLAACVTPDEWALAVKAFQKRHLFGHKLGVIDTKYVQRSGDPEAIVGRKVGMSEAEVRQLGQIVVKLGRCIQKGVGRP